MVVFEHQFEEVLVVTVLADDAALGWLCFGDPGQWPELPDEPSCCDGCGCADVASDAAEQVRAAPPPPATPAPADAATHAAAPAAAPGWVVPGLPLAADAQTVDPAEPLRELGVLLDDLQRRGPVSGSRVDTAVLLRLAERLRALALRELAQMDDLGGHLQAGHRGATAASWLRDELLLTDSAARRQVRLARQLRDELPEVGELVLTGDTTLEHAGAVTDGVRGLDGDVVRDAAGSLCALALAADPVEVRRRLRDLAAAVDDRLAAQAERRSRERMGLRLSEVGASTAVDGTLAGQDGATVRLAMALAVEATRQADDTRGTAARQADVLIGWAAAYLDAYHSPGDSLASDAHTVRTHLLVTCTPEHLATTPLRDGERPSLADLLDRSGDSPVSPTIVGDTAPLSRGALRRLACDATLDLVVLAPGRTCTCHGPDQPSTGDDCTGEPCTSRPGRAGRVQPLYVGRSARTVSGAQFKALVVRDRTCIVRGCHRPPAQCAAHHVKHWADGGTTDLDNLVLLCHQHHHDHHDRGQDLPHHDGRWLTQLGWAQAPP